MDLDAPTQRPDEPMSAGVDWGPGPGSEALFPAGLPSGDRLVDELRAVYVRTNAEALREIIEELEGG